MNAKSKPMDLSPHLFERSAPQLAKLVGLGDLAAAPVWPLHEGRTGPVRPTEVVVQADTVDSAALSRAGVVEFGGKRTRASEEFRIVQDQILRLLATDTERPAGRDASIVMITSAAPGEGKSFVAANLAVSLARCSERDILLVDTDPKPESLSYALGLGTVPGLLDMPDAGDAPAPVKVYGTSIARLTVLPLGGGADRSALSATSRLPDRLTRLGSLFASCVIVLDAPPCLASSDASMLASLVDQVVMVIEAGSTQQSDIEAALDLVQSCSNIALLLNKVRSAAGSGFGSYGDYT